MTNTDQLTECLRCGAMVGSMTKHKRWHQQLEKTSDRLPPDPDGQSRQMHTFP